MITISHVTKKYGNTVVLEDITYTFPEKGIVCLMGPSGSGKTTLLNLLAGFDTDYAGEITVGSGCITKMDADSLCRYRRDQIGFVFQNYHLLNGYTVLENVCLASELSAASKEESRQKAAGILNRIGMEEKKDQKVENLSGGQKQRAAIARALMGNPQILLADEPTGALDRTTSTEIMKLLQEIAKDRLVVVITHDSRICDFADEIIHLENGKLVTEQEQPHSLPEYKPMAIGPDAGGALFAHAARNFKVHIKRYAAAATALSVGLLAFLFSLSFGNVIEHAVDDFRQKNTALHNGYIQGADDGTIFDYLNSDKRIEHVYYQYKVENVSLSVGEKTQMLSEKFPMPKATESLSYGIMPRHGKAEIAITPSLAKKFDTNIKNLPGTSLLLKFAGESYKLTISGIYNAGYDDFFVSSDIEQLFYEKIPKEKNDAISYDVKEFEDIVAVSNRLELHGIKAKTAAEEVAALQQTFDRLQKLFFLISVLILGMGVSVCGVLLVKLQNTRFQEMGLLAALGFRSKQTAWMVGYENLLLSFLAAAINILFIGAGIFAGNLAGLPLLFQKNQMLLSVAAVFVLVMLLSGGASYRLIRTEPAIALRK